MQIRLFNDDKKSKNRKTATPPIGIKYNSGLFWCVEIYLLGLRVNLNALNFKTVIYSPINNDVSYSFFKYFLKSRIRLNECTEKHGHDKRQFYQAFSRHNELATCSM